MANDIPATDDAATDVPTTVQDIINAQQDALAAVDAQITTTSDLQTGVSSDAKIDKALKSLRAKRTAIFDQNGDAILASADLDAALKVMKAATKHMNDTANVMKTVTGVLKNITKFLGFGNQVVTTLQSVSKKT